MEYWIVIIILAPPPISVKSAQIKIFYYNLHWSWFDVFRFFAI
jgi:hypothetical protein